MAKNKVSDRKPGRPVDDRKDSDKAKSYTVSLTPNENEFIIKRYGGRTEALKNLCKLLNKGKK